MKVIRDQKHARAMVTSIYAHVTQEFDESFYLPEVEATNKTLIKKFKELEIPKKLDIDLT